MRSIQVGQEVELTDGEFVITELSRGAVKLRNSQTAEYIIVSSSELSNRLRQVTSDAASNTSGLPSPRIIEETGADKDPEFLRWLANIQEVIDGTPVAPNTSPRREYDPATTTLSGRAETKSIELKAAGIDVAAITIRRKAKQVATSGPAGLIDKRHARKSSPLGRADPRLTDTLIYLMAEERNRSTGTKGRLLARLESELQKRYPNAEIAVPSRSTLFEYLRRLDGGKYTFGSAPNRRSAANAPRHVFSSRPASFPGEEVQIDSSPWDIIVLDQYGRQRKAHITIMIDKATHSILAASVNLNSANGFDHAVLLARCLAPTAVRRRHMSFLDGNLPELPDLPWAKFLDEDIACTYDKSRPYIKPHRIIIDNGGDFLSLVFRSACEQYGISLTEASITTPTDKAAVERAFLSIKTMFLEKLPGYTGGSHGFRGKNPGSDEGLWDIETLGAILNYWIDAVWQNYRTDALRDPFAPAICHSPNSMYLAMLPMTGVVPMELTLDEYINLMPIQYRTVQRDGIEIWSRQYDSPHLAPFRMMPSGDRSHKNRWAIRWDPYDKTAVWVVDPSDQSWIECEWMNDSAFDKPFNRTIFAEARRIGAEMGTLNNADSTKLLLDILARTTTSRKQHELTEARNQLAIVRPERDGVEAAKRRGRTITEAPPLLQLEHATNDYTDVGIFDPDERIL